jgi:hypothetical protein
MGKVKLDPMFKDLNKRVGNYVHCKWKGQHIIRTYNPDRPASTSAQIEVQNAFKTTAAVWRRMPEIIKQSWKPFTLGKPLTELNVFMKENANRQRLGNQYILTRGSGVEKLTGLTADSSTPGAVSVDFDMPAGEVNLSVIIQGITDGAGNTEINIRPDVYQGSKPVQITGLKSGEEYFIYCFTTDAEYADSAMVSESSCFKVSVV